MIVLAGETFQTDLGRFVAKRKIFQQHTIISFWQQYTILIMISRILIFATYKYVWDDRRVENVQYLLLSNYYVQRLNNLY